MSLFIASLNSGSNGNCYYIGNDDEAVLIDAGISCRETEKRMKRLELSLKKVKAIFITHEHGDHIHGVPALSRRHDIPVYITEATLRGGGFQIREDMVRSFKAHEPIRIGNLSVTAFPKLHDACDPHSFVVDCNDVRVGVFTDIGTPCEHVTTHFSQCHAAFLEANYDEDMLERGRYPLHLKARIRGDHGHLSNHQAMELFMRHRPQGMSHLLLSHLSQDNNSPELVKDLFSRIANGTEIIVASRYEESSVYPVHYTPLTYVAPQSVIPVRVQKAAMKKLQLSLFQ